MFDAPALVVFAVFVVFAGEVHAQQASLVALAKQGDWAAVEQRIRPGAAIDEPDGDGTTALHWAAYRDRLATADLLIRARADVNAANDLGATPLWIASQNGSAAMVGRLLEAGADPNRALLAGETPLMVAARSGNPAVVELLLKRGAHVNARAARGQTALMWAAAEHHPDVVQVLLAHKADVHARSAEWSQMMAVPPHGRPEYNREIPHGGNTALMFAAREGDLASATLLVAAGANVNDRDAWGVSAVTLAAHAGFTELVEFLLEKGADPKAADAGFAPLHIAVMRRDERMARVLLARGASPDARLEAWTPTRRSSADFNFAPELVGATPLWLAARFANAALMRLLIDRGANARFVHRVTYRGGERAELREEATTILMAAAGMGGGAPWSPIPRGEREALTLEAVRLAVELGVDVNAANIDGRTALDAARASKLERVAAFLVERGAQSGRR
ncbi:MAG: ankyrin repeat domain-containing protein [Acidobacteriota bacterium]